MSVYLGETEVKAIVTSFESEVDSYIRRFLSNTDNIRKVIGLDVELSVLDESEATEDCSKGSYWSYGRKYDRKSTDPDEKRAVNSKQAEDAKMKSRVAILQLCDGVSCLIIQLPFLDSIPKSLLNFLQLPDFVFVGIGIKGSVAELEKEHGIGCKNAVELVQLAASVMQMPHLAACGVDFLAHVVDQ